MTNHAAGDVSGARTCRAHLVLAPADVAWKSCALRIEFFDPRWVPNPARQSRCGRALQLRVSRESEVAANETRAAVAARTACGSLVTVPPSGYPILGRTVIRVCRHEELRLSGRRCRSNVLHAVRRFP